MNLLEQSPVWLIPFGFLMLGMLHAMMEFTVSLLVQRPQVKRKPVPADRLRQRLLAVKADDPLYQVVKGKDCDLEICWESNAAPYSGRWAIAKAASEGCVRLLLDELRYELRMNEISHSYYFIFGLTGWLPRLSGYAGMQSGPPGSPLVKELSQVANRNGWSVRPVLWWFQATYGGYQLLAALTPPPIRQWPARHFWGVLYPFSYGLGMAYLVLISSFERRDWLLLIGISAVWWGVWGFLVWMLCGFPAFWQRKHR